VKGCEADAFPKLTAHLGTFTPYTVDPAIFPQNDTFRAAWTYQDGKIGHDMVTAREIHRKRLREARKAHLAALDVVFMRNLETGGDNAPVTAEKQRLRDAPADPRIDAAKTIAELKAVWPL
jgi:hypothetical protein